MGIETGEFSELHDGPGHDEAVARVEVRRVVTVGSGAKKGYPIFVFEDCGVLECKRVTLETEGSGQTALRQHQEGCHLKYVHAYPLGIANHFQERLEEAAVVLLSAKLPRPRNFS